MAAVVEVAVEVAVAVEAGAKGRASWGGSKALFCSPRVGVRIDDDDDTE